MHMNMVGTTTLVTTCLVPHVTLATVLMEPSQVLLIRRPVSLNPTGLFATKL